MEKRKEHKISSGCVILNGYVEVTLTKDHANSTLSQIEAKVEEAQMQRTGKQLMLERFARIWTPLVLLTVSRLSQTWKSATRFFPHSPWIPMASSAVARCYLFARWYLGPVAKVSTNGSTAVWCLGVDELPIFPLRSARTGGVYWEYLGNFGNIHPSGILLLNIIEYQLIQYLNKII